MWSFSFWQSNQQQSERRLAGELAVVREAMLACMLTTGAVTGAAPGV
jgi:hypothetical protein